MSIIQTELQVNQLQFSQQKDPTQKSNEKVDDLEWLKPRQLIKPEDQEDVPEAVRISLFFSYCAMFSYLSGFHDRSE